MRAIPIPQGAGRLTAVSCDWAMSLSSAEDLIVFPRFMPDLEGPRLDEVMSPGSSWVCCDEDDFGNDGGGGDDNGGEGS